MRREDKKIEEVFGQGQQLTTTQKFRDILYALNQSAIVAITDQTGEIVFVNDKFAEISQYTVDELIGENHRIINSSYHSREFFKEMWRTIGNGNVWRADIRNQRKDGSYYWVDTTIIPFLNAKGKPYQYISIRYEITERKEAEARIAHLAYNDQLTNLPNRLYFRRKLYEIVAAAKTNKKKVCLIRFDVDRLRHINESLGYEAGDYVLSVVARRLEHGLPESCVLANLGGDQFGVIFDNERDISEAETIVQEIIAATEQPIKLDGEYYTISLSSGLSFFPQYAKSAPELSSTSEKALLEMKAKGGSGYYIYKPEQVEKSIARIVLENELRKSVAEGYFHLDYQPQVDLNTKKIIGLEALVRWRHPELGLIPPNEFIYVAEETRIIISLGEWILREACRQSKEWQDKGYRKKMAVNVSFVQLNDENFLPMVKSVLAEIGNDPSLLELELTESVFGNHPEVYSIFHEIRALGIQVSIDDFGTGYSSLSYLKELPIDTLKIDRAFVHDIESEGDNMAIIKAIHEVGDSVGLNMVVEGIETLHQLKVLNQIGYRIGQGYYFSRPIDAEACEKLMAENGELA